MNGKELLEYFNKMSKEELENTYYDIIAFDLNDVDCIYEEIMENGLYDPNSDEEIYDNIFSSLSIEKKREIMKNALKSNNLNSIRSQYITSICDEMREKILKTLEMENK